ncbi:MAG: SDR family oxidoreductase [Chloroflexi bacterium]|nr:SDR family oxidoreductase [Chloroflexota bacterium]
MHILYLGGTGNISNACVARSLALGQQVTIMTRGRTEAQTRPGVNYLRGDRYQLADLERAAELRPDAVVDFIGYTADQLELALTAFRGKTGQYLFISSAVVYQKPPTCYRITEDTPHGNPFWQYALDKIACEALLQNSASATGIPYTIVRPSYTYDQTWIPVSVGGHGYLVVERMRRGVPVVVHGDGQSLWTMTHASDFAVGLCGLIGNPQVLGQAYHITSDEVLNWDTIYHTIATAAGVQAQIVHLPSEVIATLVPAWGPTLLGDKMYSCVYINDKIKAAVPEFAPRVSFAEGMRRSLAWYDADARRRQVNPEGNARMDLLVAHYRKLLDRA